MITFLCTYVLISNVTLVLQASSFLEKVQRRPAELYRFGVPRCQCFSQAKSHIAHHTPSFVTRLTLSFFRIDFDGALRLFPAVDTEAEVDALEAAIPLLEPNSTVAVAGVHSTTAVIHYDVEGPHGCAENHFIRKFCHPQWRCIFTSIFSAHIRDLYAPSQLCRSYIPDDMHMVLHMYTSIVDIYPQKYADTQ